MTIEDDIHRIEAQERRLQFAAFDSAVAWQIALYLRKRGEAASLGIVVDIGLWSLPLVSFALPGATLANYDWVRRKRNTVRTFAKSSYAVGLTLERDGDTLPVRQGLELKDYAIHGGGFPLHMEGMGVIGSIVVSGLPQRDDHELAVTAVAQVLGVKPPRLN